MKSYRFAVPRGTGRMLLAFVIALVVWALVACGSSSSDSADPPIPPDPPTPPAEVTAFVFSQDTLNEAAFLAADRIDVLFPVSQIANLVAELGESDVRQIDLSADFCEGVGTATLTVPPIAAGVDALLAVTDCGDDALTGTFYFRIQNYTAGAQTPAPFMAARVDLDLRSVMDGIQDQANAEFQLEAFRDPQSIGFRYFGSDAYWFLTEGTETEKLGCFDFNLRYILDAEDEISEIRFGTPYAVLVYGTNGTNRLFSITGELTFAEIDDEFEVVGGTGLDFSPEVLAPGSVCAVVGAPDGIEPGTTRMELRPDPLTFGGVVLVSFEGDEETGSVRTTWGEIID